MTGTIQTALKAPDLPPYLQEAGKIIDNAFKDTSPEAVRPAEPTVTAAPSTSPAEKPKAAPSKPPTADQTVEMNIDTSIPKLAAERLGVTV